MPILKNIRHERIVQAYISNDGDQSAAYRIGYPSSLKWKDRTVHSRASEVFKRSEVVARIAEIQKRLEKKEIITKEFMIEDLKKMSEVSILDYVESCAKRSGKVTWKDPKDWTPAMRRACTGIKPTRNGIELTVFGVEYAYTRIAKMMGYDAPIKTINADTSIEDILFK